MTGINNLYFNYNDFSKSFLKNIICDMHLNTKGGTTLIVLQLTIYRSYQLKYPNKKLYSTTLL